MSAFDSDRVTARSSGFASEEKVSVQKSKHLPLTIATVLICFNPLNQIVSMTKKKLPKTTDIIPVERLVRQIYLVRGLKVMLDRDLAELYGVTTGNLNLAVRRNIDRFPEDFMFQLTKEELNNWRLQIATSNSAAKMGLRRRPYAFTEQGVAMLSSVLHSERAVQMNILIVRAFVKLREMLATHKDLAERMEKIEAAQERHTSVIELLAEEIDGMKELPPEAEKTRIGFSAGRK